MYKIVFADGSELPVRGCGQSDGFLWIYTPSGDEHTMMEYAMIFCDVNRTDQIQFIYGSLETVYDHYTKVELIQHNDAGRSWSICLKKQHVVIENDTDRGETDAD